MDINDMSNLSLYDLMPSDSVSLSQADLILRAIEQKLLNIPDKIARYNKNVDFTSGRNEEVMIDIDSMTTGVYELVANLRLCLSSKGGK
tara:strand:+ start:78 stop:344 length:267 start_codon:yes stop_codon:yes gene_type:complete